MPEETRTQKIGVSAICRVSTKGGAGTYLYIPRLFAETYGLISGNVVEVYFRKVYRKVFQEETENPESRTVDLSKERGKRKTGEE